MNRAPVFHFASGSLDAIPDDGRRWAVIGAVAARADRIGADLATAHAAGGQAAAALGAGASAARAIRAGWSALAAAQGYVLPTAAETAQVRAGIEAHRADRNARDAKVHA